MNRFIAINPENCSIIDSKGFCPFKESVSHNGFVIGFNCTESDTIWLNGYIHKCPLCDRNNLPTDLPDASGCDGDYDDDDTINQTVDVWGSAGPDCSTGWSKASA